MEDRSTDNQKPLLPKFTIPDLLSGKVPISEVQKHGESIFKKEDKYAAPSPTSSILKGIQSIKKSMFGPSEVPNPMFQPAEEVRPIVAGINIEDYATDPLHEKKIHSIMDDLPEFVTTEDMTKYIKDRAPESSLNGDMINTIADKYGLDPKLLISLFQQDSLFGTKGLGRKTKNPGNFGNDDEGRIRKFNTWTEGVDAVAKWLSERKHND